MGLDLDLLNSPRLSYAMELAEMFHYANTKGTSIKFLAIPDRRTGDVQWGLHMELADGSIINGEGPDPDTAIRKTHTQFHAYTHKTP